METILSITAARKTLLTISRQAKRHLKRFIFTKSGEPQVVLLSIDDYRSLIAGGELLQNPGIVKETERGRQQLETGKPLPLMSLRVPQRSRKRARQLV